MALEIHQVLGKSQVTVTISLILLLPLSHNISIERVQDTLVGQLKGIVQNLFAFTTEKYNHNSYTMSYKSTGSLLMYSTPLTR